jgi:hypothetical protein
MENITQPVNGKEDKISKIINNVLKQVFGEKATHLIYRYMEKRYSIKQNEVSEKLDLFAKGLEEFLSSGAIVIERRILEDIYSNYGLLCRLERTQDESDFVNQVRLLMQKA